MYSLYIIFEVLLITSNLQFDIFLMGHFPDTE